MIRHLPALIVAVMLSYFQGEYLHRAKYICSQRSTAETEGAAKFWCDFMYLRAGANRVGFFRVNESYQCIAIWKEAR